MFDSLDPGTLQRCGMLASLCFAAVFAGQWRAGKDRAHLLCWAGAATCHAITIAGSIVAGPSTGGVMGSLLYAAIAVGPLLIVAGVRSFDGRRPVARWMIVPILLAAAGDGIGQVIGGAVAVQLGAAGLAAIVVVVGVALLRSRPDGAPDRGTGGRRMTGWAMLGYLPGYACVIVGGGVPAGLAAKLTMVDLLLTIFITLGLLAMPGQRAIAVMRERNHRDPLTGAHSRAWLMTKAPALAERGSTVIVFDVDRFKQINDSLGHAAGDAVLIALIARLGDPVRAQGGRIVRLGGDEFVAILPATLSMGAAMRLARLLRRVAAMTPAGVPACTISVGLAQVEGGEDRLDRAIAHADQALYRAKAEGRDRVAA